MGRISMVVPPSNGARFIHSSTSSRDGGCTWVAATGELAGRFTSGLAADPVDGKRAWVATNDGASTKPWNGVFTTTDDGLTWTPTLQVDEYLDGVAVSPDGTTLYVNLYSPSTLDWRERSLTIEQRTRYPFEGASAITT